MTDLRRLPNNEIIKVNPGETRRQLFERAIETGVLSGNADDYLKDKTDKENDTVILGASPSKKKDKGFRILPNLQRTTPTEDKDEDEGFVDSVQNFFTEDIPDFLRMSADAQLQANKVQVEAAGLAAPIVARAALETAKTPVNIAAMIGDITAPRTMDEIRQSEVGKFYADVIEKVTPEFKEEVKEESEIAAELLSYMGGWKVGQKIFSELGEVLINKFGKTKAQKIAIEMERKIAKGGKTKADKVVEKIGYGGSAFGSWGAGSEMSRQRDTDVATELAQNFSGNTEEVRAILEQYSLKEVLDYLTPDVVQNQIADFLLEPDKQQDIANALKLINAGPPAELIINLAEKLKRDPNDTASQAALKRYAQELGFYLTGGIITAIPFVGYFLGRFGKDAVIETGKGIVKGGKFINRKQKELRNIATELTTESAEELGRIGRRIAPLPAPEQVPLGSKLRDKIPAVIQDNVVTKKIARWNTAVGEIASSRAALPKTLYNNAVERKNATDSIMTEVNFELKQLRELQTKYGISDEAFEKAFNTGKFQDLPEEFVTKLNQVTEQINVNERLLNRSLGLKGDSRLGLRADGQDFFVVRSYLASNPEYVAKIRRGLNDKLKPKDLKDDPYGTNTMEFIDNARDMLRKKGVPADEIDAQIDMIVTNLLPNQTNKNLIERVVGIGKDLVGSVQQQTTKSLAKRKDLEGDVLNLLGQVKNPYKNLENTLFAQNKILSEIRYLKSIEKLAKENVDGDIRLPGFFPLLPSQRAKITAPDPSVKTSTGKKGVTGTGNETRIDLDTIAKDAIGRFGGDSGAILKNLVSTPEFARIVSRGVDLYNPTSNGSFMRGLSKAASLTQAKETLFDPQAYVLNTSGAIQSLLLNGHAFNPKNYTQAVREVKTLANKLDAKDPEAVATNAMLKRLGVIDQDLIGAQITANAEIVGSQVAGKGAKTFEKVMGKFGSAYGAPDTFSKLVAFQAEKRSAMAIYPRKKLVGPGKKFKNNAEYEEFINKEAARVVRDTVPTYGSSPRVARALAQTPLIGNYVLFPTELARTYKNALIESGRDIVQGAATLNAAQVSRGLRRSAGIYTMGVGLPAAYDQLDDMFSWDDSTHRAFNSTGAPYQRGGRHIPLEGLILDETAGDSITRDQVKKQFPKETFENIKKELNFKGSYDKFITERLKEQKQNFKPFIRTRTMHSSSVEFMDQLNSIGRLAFARSFGDDRMTSEMIDGAIGSIRDTALNSYISPKALVDRVLSAFVGVDIKTGRPLYDEAVGATTADKILDFASILAESGQGGAYKIVEEYLKGKDAEKLMGEAIATNRFGTPYNTDDLLTWVATGGRTRTHNVNQRFGYSIYRDLKAIDELTNNFKTILKQQEPSLKTSDDIKKIVNEYKELQERKRVGLQNLHDKLNTFTDVYYKRRYYDKNKNIKEETKKLTREDVIRFATRDLRYNPSTDLLVTLSQDDYSKAFMLPDLSLFETNDLQNLTPDLMNIGFRGDAYKELVTQLADAAKEYVKKPLFTEEEIEQRKFEDKDMDL